MIKYFAMKFVESGISVIPIKYKDKRPDARLLPKVDDQPSWDPYKTRIPSMDELDTWFSNRINYGVVVGWQNLAILDFDDTTGYTSWLTWCARQSGIAEYVAKNAFRVSSSRGVHIYIRLTQGEKKNRKLAKIDFKASGYVLGPGSIHPSGAEYKPIRDVWNFPVIQTLSDILPVELLVQDSPIPSKLSPPPPAVVSVWQNVNNPRNFTGSGSLVKKIKTSFKLEDYFPDAQTTSTDKRWMLVRCPLHDDYNPSMWIDTEHQICGCFSGCTPKPLDVIGLYARAHGLGNGEAIWALARAFG